MFELDNVGFSLNGRALLHPVTLQLPRGRIIGLIGHNGSGKSTLLKLLARQLAPSSGSLTLDGEALATWKTQRYAQQVAYLPQQLPAAEGMTVQELVGMGRYPWHGALGRYDRQDREHVERALRLTGTDRFAQQLVDTLSGGERQRVWLAMLLAQNSRYLLLDEPTSALDIAHQVEVLQQIQTLGRQLDLGIILVLHEINMAARYCDHLIALRAGRVLVEGSPAELMNGSTLQAIYGIPMDVLPHPHDGTPLGFHC